MRCLPCERTFAVLTDLVLLMEKEELSTEGRIQLAVAKSSLANAGMYLVDMKIREAHSPIRNAYE